MLDDDDDNKIGVENSESDESKLGCSANQNHRPRKGLVESSGGFCMD